MSLEREMRVESVEIYSDTTNSAIMRHPDRHFPGVLMQGDTLYSLCQRADDVCASIGRESPAFEEANKLRNVLWGYLSHYKNVLTEHGLTLPFSERPIFS
jgi:hypothetical protein